MDQDLAHHPLGIGELSRRSGAPSSTLRFYEDEGLLHPVRTPGGQRRYRRDALRRVAFIRVGQRVGLPLRQIREALDRLPAGRTPTARDWSSLSARWRTELDDRIAALLHLRDDLGGCIGCGCLSLTQCSLLNPGDALGEGGAGPRRWSDDSEPRPRSTRA